MTSIITLLFQLELLVLSVHRTNNAARDVNGNSSLSPTTQ